MHAASAQRGPHVPNLKGPNAAHRLQGSDGKCTPKNPSPYPILEDTFYPTIVPNRGLVAQKVTRETNATFYLTVELLQVGETGSLRVRAQPVLNASCVI